MSANGKEGKTGGARQDGEGHAHALHRTLFHTLSPPHTYTFTNTHTNALTHSTHTHTRTHSHTTNNGQDTERRRRNRQTPLPRVSMCTFVLLCRVCVCVCVSLCALVYRVLVGLGEGVLECACSWVDRFTVEKYRKPPKTPIKYTKAHLQQLVGGCQKSTP